ncbi:MAG TPA: DUF4398 domain-containing protein [Stellaceae bacterium]|nr:DUF4398 domain-containing protein [Stellaceae bacterium]
MTARTPRISALPLLALLAAAGLGGCGSADIPAAQYAVSRTTLAAAERAGAARYAPQELATARLRLGQARAAAQAGDDVIAHRLAMEAEADARLAEVTARARATAEIATAFRTDLEALRQRVPAAPGS